jgi:hypothetical protein
MTFHKTVSRKGKDSNQNIEYGEAQQAATRQQGEMKNST